MNPGQCLYYGNWTQSKSWPYSAFVSLSRLFEKEWRIRRIIKVLIFSDMFGTSSRGELDEDYIRGVVQWKTGFKRLLSGAEIKQPPGLKSQWNSQEMLTYPLAYPKIQDLVEKWAPLVFLAPGEKFFPSSVTEFLDHMIPIPLQDTGSTVYDEKPLSEQRGGNYDDLPKGRSSESWYLTSREDLEKLLRNKTSFIYGQNPQEHSVPVYALIEVCQNEPAFKRRFDRIKSFYNVKQNTSYGQGEGYPNFHVTYWMFYPFSQGKSLCTFDMGRFGAWPIPKVNNYCLGNIKEFGSHVGDWEHISLYFEGSDNPKKMYVSTHDVGAFYKYSKEYNRFEYESKEIRRGILQRPMFPPVMRLSKPGNHPVLFSAKGSHGLWTAPGRHRFVRIPRLHDDSGFGIPWFTWKNVQLLKAVSPTQRNWLRYHGKWGNPKSRCHPISKLGINICEISDGPTGIPLKKKNFHCPLPIIGNNIY